jgi:NADP-dependent 3-hydroxy acid dehydrogenase YdfG
LVAFQSIALFHAHTHPKIIILLARTTEQLSSVASEISAIDSDIKVIKGSVDVTDAQAVNIFFTNLRDNEKVGRIDVLFNNAGYLEVIGAAENSDLVLRH